MSARSPGTPRAARFMASGSARLVSSTPTRPARAQVPQVRQLLQGRQGRQGRPAPAPQAQVPQVPQGRPAPDRLVHPGPPPLGGQLRW